MIEWKSIRSELSNVSIFGLCRGFPAHGFPTAHSKIMGCWVSFYLQSGPGYEKPAIEFIKLRMFLHKQINHIVCSGLRTLYLLQQSNGSNVSCWFGGVKPIIPEAVNVLMIKSCNGLFFMIWNRRFGLVWTGHLEFMNSWIIIFEWYLPENDKRGNNDVVNTY